MALFFTTSGGNRSFGDNDISKREKSMNMKRFTIDMPMDMGTADEEQCNAELVEFAKAFVAARTGKIPETIEVSAEDI